MTKFLATVLAFAFMWVVSTILMALFFYWGTGEWAWQQAASVAAAATLIGGTLGLAFNG